MTCGIYTLKFQSTNKVYVGQSIRIEKRFTEHLIALRKNTASPKLQNAFDTYGEPILLVILECSIAELDEYETLAIEILDSVNNGFNHYSSSNDAPTYNGFGFGNSKYTKKQILDTVQQLIESPNLSCEEIGNITGVHRSTVLNLLNTETHQWIWEEYPDKYLSLRNTRSNREKLISVSISNKLSAKAKGIIYPIVKDPDGKEYQIDNAYRFAKEKGLAPNHFQEVLNGHRKSHKGWKLS